MPPNTDLIGMESQKVATTKAAGFDNICVKLPFWSFEFNLFELVSNFDIRFSDLIFPKDYLLQ